MKRDTLNLLRGSGNVFRDLGHKNGDVLQCKAILAAEILEALDRDGLSVRVVHVDAAVGLRLEHDSRAPAQLLIDAREAFALPSLARRFEYNDR